MDQDLPTLDVTARGFDFTVRRAGPPEGVPVLLLHGFPETSMMWEPLMAALAAAGHACVAPDQRGYSPGARPAGIDAYRHEELVADVFAIADAVGWSRFHLVAHDWGAGVGWLALRQAPGRIASFTALSIPHYRAFAQSTWSDPEAESYRRFLELVLAPDAAAERILGRDGMASFRATWPPNPRLAHEYVRVLGAPGALSAALAWYRAADGHRRLLSAPETPADAVAVPTLLIWGRRDPYVCRSAVDGAERFMRGPYRRLDLDAGHWLAQEQPLAVRDAVLTHLSEHPL